MRLRAFAKINLDLRILSIRPDGYHDISTVFQSVSLHDVVSVEEQAGPVVVTCDDPAIPAGDGNLAAKAVRQVWNACGRAGAPSDVRIHIEKRVPAQAGLGGGSADAAAVVFALGRLWGLQDEDPRLSRAAAAVGADVAYFLVGGTALGTGRGDVLTPLDDQPALHAVIVKPSFGVSTVEAYRWFDEMVGAVEQGRVAASIREGRMLSGCRNQMERAVAIRRPEIAELSRRFRALDARLASMSGSGSAVFGLFDTPAQADAAAEVMGRDARLAVFRCQLVGREEYRAGRVIEDP